jgi:hypothetical protein
MAKLLGPALVQAPCQTRAAIVFALEAPKTRRRRLRRVRRIRSIDIRDTHTRAALD